jgi:broad specificity phosphatase PhoE
MPTRITLICHAATPATRAAAFPVDEPLEKEPAPASGTVTSLRRVHQCWTSPALCARQTAAALELAPAIDPDLRECDYGRWAGRRLSDIGAEEPDAIAIWLADVNAAPHGGESIANVRQRIAAWLDGRIGENGHGVAVTHAAVIRCAILHVIGAAAQSFWHIDVGPLSMTELRHDGSRWRWRAGRVDNSHFE